MADPSSPTLVRQLVVDGTIASIRMTGDVARLVVQSPPDDLGFVSPSNPAGEARALQTNKDVIAVALVASVISAAFVGAAPLLLKSVGPAGKVTCIGLVLASMATVTGALGQLLVLTGLAWGLDLKNYQWLIVVAGVLAAILLGVYVFRSTLWNLRAGGQDAINGPRGGRCRLPPRRLARPSEAQHRRALGRPARRVDPRGGDAPPRSPV